MQLSISIESILKKVYAISALRSYLTSTPSGVTPFLTQDNRSGLIPVMQEALSHVVVDLLPYVQVLTPPNTIDDLIELEIDVRNLPSGTDSVMESAIVERMLQIINAPVSETTSSQFAAMAGESTSTLRTIITESSMGCMPGPVRWNRY